MTCVITKNRPLFREMARSIDRKIDVLDLGFAGAKAPGQIQNLDEMPFYRP
jgi:hypothetical protein